MNQKGIIFDLDDTLYSEKDYVISGFMNVAVYLEEKYDINYGDSFMFLKSRFEANGREQVFDALLEKFMSKKNEFELTQIINNMVEVYRGHVPNIKLDIEIIDILKKIKKLGWQMSIVTDGLPSMQKNKISSLGLELLVDNIIYCWEHNSPKPSSLGFKIASEKMNIDIRNCIVVGDHPEKDIVPARKLNARAYRIKTERFGHLDANKIYPPLKTFSSLADFFQEVVKYAYK